MLRLPALIGAASLAEDANQSPQHASEHPPTTTDGRISRSPKANNHSHVADCGGGKTTMESAVGVQMHGARIVEAGTTARAEAVEAYLPSETGM